MLRRLFPVVLACVAACLFAAGCGLGGGGRLVVGIDLSSPPFGMKDEKGEPAGVNVDLARELAKSLGRELAIESVPADGLVAALEAGKIELGISSLARTAEGSKSIDFSSPYAETGICLLVAKDSPVQTARDLDQAGRTVVVARGTSVDAWATANLKQAKVVVVATEAEGVLQVAGAKADALICNQLPAYQHWKQNEATTRLLLQPLQKEQWAIGLRKGNDALREKIDDFLSDFRIASGFEKLGEKWLKDTKAGFKKVNQVFIF